MNTAVRWRSLTSGRSSASAASAGAAEFQPLRRASSARIGSWIVARSAAAYESLVEQLRARVAVLEAQLAEPLPVG